MHFHIRIPEFLLPSVYDSREKADYELALRRLTTYGASHYAHAEIVECTQPIRYVRGNATVPSERYC